MAYIPVYYEKDDNKLPVQLDQFWKKLGLLGFFNLKKYIFFTDQLPVSSQNLMLSMLLFHLPDYKRWNIPYLEAS